MFGDFVGVEEGDDSRKGIVMIDNVSKIAHAFVTFVFRESIIGRVERDRRIDYIELVMPAKEGTNCQL